MAVRQRSTRSIAAGITLPVLLGSVLLVIWGCEPTPQRVASTNQIGTVPADENEARLLAELDKKFENPQAHYELARLYHKSQNWNKAEREYDYAIDFQPGNKAAQAGLVKMYIDRGDTAKGEQFANGYLRQAAGSTTETLRLAAEFQKLGMDDYALRGLQQALAAAPDSFEANRDMGLYYLDKNDTAKAKQYLVRSFKLNPRQPDVAGALGRLGVVVELPGTPSDQTAPQPKS
jgi:tetratricopeptide (TPR) repeat protein